MTFASALVFSIIVPTFRRPEDLGGLLAALNSQGVPDDVEILVVDNCPDRSAASVAGLNSHVIYLSEPRPGVAYARNAGVARAQGRYVIFIDDDERPGPDWLEQWRKLASAGADAGFGAVQPVFDVPPDPALRPVLEGLFSREMNLPDGTDITARRAYLGTGNSMFSRAACFADGPPFDPRFNAGGEDVWFLRQLVEKRGVRLVWSSQTPVSERVPASRMSVAYIRGRKFRNGQMRCIVEAGGGHWVAVAFWMAAGLTQAGLYGLAALMLSPFDKQRSAAFLTRAAGGLGKVLWWK